MGVVCLRIHFNVLVHSYSCLRLRLSAFQMERTNFLFLFGSFSRIAATGFKKCTWAFPRRHSHDSGVQTAHMYSRDVIPAMWSQNCSLSFPRRDCRDGRDCRDVIKRCVDFTPQCLEFPRDEHSRDRIHSAPPEGLDERGKRKTLR